MAPFGFLLKPLLELIYIGAWHVHPLPLVQRVRLASGRIGIANWPWIAGKWNIYWALTLFYLMDIKYGSLRVDTVKFFGCVVTLKGTAKSSYKRQDMQSLRDSMEKSAAGS